MVTCEMGFGLWAVETNFSEKKNTTTNKLGKLMIVLQE